MSTKVTQQKITPFLWFENQAEEAARFYTSIFTKSKIVRTTRYDEAAAKASGQPAGSVMTVQFQLEGQDFVALNGGPEFKFTKAISFVVNCDTQAELDHYWEALTKDGKEVQCGWLKDKFGVSWQIVPAILPELLSQAAPEKGHRVTQALLKMVKLDIQQLKNAAKATEQGKSRQTRRKIVF